ncbi:MAG: YbaK/EbsC family protein [Bacteroidota bacterium]|nr:YbaK/EbsC family protein [Bacteroidota bacterium]
MIGQDIVYQSLESLNINYNYYESPRDFSSEDDGSFWKRIQAERCKNLFLRNHKGNQHFLVVSKYYQPFNIKILEQHFKKGKISFASQRRLDKWIKTPPGAVSIFSLFNDTENHTRVFVDEELKDTGYVTFLPNEHNAILKISTPDFIKLLKASGNHWKFFKMR